MMNKLVELLLVLRLISVCSGMNPCVDYVFINMADGLRSSDFDSRNSGVSLCDKYLDAATWYRFEHDAGNRLMERPVEPWYCGTTAPIWLNGTHPTGTSEMTAKVCATYASENICGWDGTVRIRLCNESGSQYFVYQLAVPPGCPLSYCVDAASRKQCIPPEVWLEGEFRCGGAPPSMVPPTKVTTLTTTIKPMSPTTERQSLAPTDPSSTDWSSWGPWSVCSKPCDYGHQSRQRTCGQQPCDGPANDDRLCNEYNCQKLPEEKTRGIALVLQESDSKEDTMLSVVLNQPEIHNILRENINDICSQNVSMCCGWQYNGVSPLHQEFVLLEDIYPAQGSLEPRAANTVYYQIIAIVNEDVDRMICNGQSQRNQRRQLLESNSNFLPFDVLLMASVKSADNLFQATGLVVTEYVDPATMIEDNNGESNQVACPSLTCVLPIVLSVIVIVLALAIGGFCFARNKLKRRTEPDASPSPEPPHYEEVLSTDLRVSIKGLPYMVHQLPPIVSRNVYDTLTEPESMDFQKRDLDV